MQLFNTILVLFAVSLALAAETPCQPGPDRQPAWACTLCGPNAEGFCEPYNATFDDLKPGRPVGKYDNTTWTNFIATDNSGVAPQNRLVPYSHCNFARLPAGYKGVMQDTIGQLLFSFHYGCTSPWSTQAITIEGSPVDCLVTLTAYCGYARSAATPQQWAWNYTARPQRATPMAFTNGGNSFYIGPGYGACANYTFSARSPTGAAVDLFLDDVIFKRQPAW